MPRVNWGIDAEVIDEFDRESQFSPYTGPIPPNGVYQWRIKVLKSAAGTGEKFPQLRVGLELVPRNKDENKYRAKGQGYFVMKFLSISPDNAWVYTPFCDAIGVKGKEFTRGTITDEEGNVKKIGNWRHDGKTLVLGQLEDKLDNNNNPIKTVGWVGAVEDSAEELEDDEDEADDDGF